MTDTITKDAAAQLARAYADAMTLTSRRRYHPATSPSEVLETYLRWSKVTGIKLHNEHWEDHARAVVEELDQVRRSVFADLLSSFGPGTLQQERLT
jgi:hypothetical protein